MKKEKKDYEYLDTPPEILKRGMRLITRPKDLDRRLSASKKAKSRITIYLDSEVLEKYKEMAKEQNTGYQTLINRSLRESVPSSGSVINEKEMQDKLLKDKTFLKRLKSALAS